MKVFSVGQLNRIIKDIIDNEIMLEDVMVAGELSSFSVTRNIAYFTLKDADNLLNCVQFGAKQTFNIGDMVQIRGNIKYYPKGGKLTFNALSIEHCGQGELYQKFLELKNKLEAEGKFSEENKIPIPKFINSIGVVTSKTGAVLQDIRNVTSRRNPNLDIYVYDAQVQGKYAVEQIIEGISYFDNFSDVDVIIVARGGGSIEDLMPFNDEELANVAFICNKPLISAVGHETDFTILDFVADLRAPTPSAAAELVAFDCYETIRNIKQFVADFNNIIDNRLQDYYTDTNMSILDIEQTITGIINEENMNIIDCCNQISNEIENKINNTRYRVDLSINTLDKLNPIRLLSSGYSYISKDN
ncbi:MAG: exodeoxyribonuclease VII large subunit, partial [Clostridia bacterium]|nr:exodeoxyribonuclease VII large subunit [Clostridia bacterium]